MSYSEAGSPKAKAMVTRQVSKDTRVLRETVISPVGKESVDRWIKIPPVVYRPRDFSFAQI